MYIHYEYAISEKGSAYVNSVEINILAWLLKHGASQGSNKIFSIQAIRVAIKHFSSKLLYAFARGEG